MVIGFDGSRAFNKDRTGTENYSYQLLVNLSKIDRKNSYIVYLRPGRGVTSNWPPNFHFKTIPWPRLWTQAGLATQTFKESIDVLFIPAHTSPLIHRPGLKTVVTVHDLGAEYLPKMHQLKQQLYLKWITRYQLKSATKLIAVSKATKDDLVEKIGVEPLKVEVVYEGYDREKFKIQNSKFKIDRMINILKQYDLVPGSYFLFVGTVQPRKNLARLIEAFAKFSSKQLVESSQEQQNLTTNYQLQATKLVIAGSKGWLSDEIYALPKKLGVEERVKFLGYVEDEKLPVLYLGATALVFPSLFEGFGLPILEAQACGCPVVTSNLSSMPEVGGKGAVYVDPYSIEDIVRGFREVGEMRERLIKKGLENIKRFSWEECAKETLKTLQEAAKK